MSSPALRLAAQRGFLLLPERGLAEGVRLDGRTGRVLRYDPELPQLELARAVLDVMRAARRSG